MTNIEKYKSEMSRYALSGAKLLEFAINDLYQNYALNICGTGKLSEKDLRDGYKFLVAVEKLRIESDKGLTAEEKEKRKSLYEVQMHVCEERCRQYLQKQGRLVK